MASPEHSRPLLLFWKKINPVKFENPVNSDGWIGLGDGLERVDREGEYGVELLRSPEFRDHHTFIVSLTSS